MKKSLLLLSLLFAGFLGIAQQDDAYKVFLKYSSVAIHKAQKQMIASQKTDGGGLLAKAVILQNKAMALYAAKNNTRAVCVSAVARRYAAELIKNIDGKVGDFYLVHADEKTLLSNCASDADLYSESKQILSNPSELDKDYISSFNNLTVDFK